MMVLLKVFKSAILMVFVITIATGAIWYVFFKPIVVQGTLKSEAASLSFASAILETGAHPEDWGNRVYLPKATINDIGKALVGLVFISSQGKKDLAGRYDGTFVIALDSLTFETGTQQLRPRLSVTASYAPDRVTPWWSNTRVALTIDAQLMPTAQYNPTTGTTSVGLRIVPASVRPNLSWNPVELYTAGQLVSEIIAAGVLLKYGEELDLVVPAIKAPLKIEARVNSSSYSNFDKGGGYVLQAKLDGPTFERLIIADLPLITPDGIWMLGQAGRVLSKPPRLPSDPIELQKFIEKLKPSVTDALKPFKRTDGIVEVRVSNQQILQLASEIQKPWKGGGSVVKIGSANASGTIANAFLLKDNLLGDVGITVTPRVPDFLKGEVRFMPPQLTWVPGTGLSSTVAASAKMKASGHIHLSTGGVGGGIGKDIDLIGETRIALPIFLKLEKTVTPKGTAIALQTVLSCTRIAIDVNPSTREDIVKNAWISLKPFGVRVKRNVGGGRQAPSILLDSLPNVVSIGEKIDEETSHNDYYLRHKEFQISWSFDDFQVQDDGLKLRAQVLVEQNALRSSEIERKRAELKEALLSSAPGVPCEASDEYALLLVGNQVEIGSNNEVIKFIRTIFKEGGRIADETKKELQKLKETPLDSIVNAPGNAARELKRGVEGIRKYCDHNYCPKF